MTTLDWKVSPHPGESLLAAVARGCAEAVGSGRPEAILREHVQPVLAELLASEGLRSEARDEMRLAVPAPSAAHELDAPLVTIGRADAIYNRFVIEFEPPGSLRPSVMHSNTQHAISQVEQYLRGLSDHTKLPLERLAGCAFDGSWISYVTFGGGEWQVSRPRLVDADSLDAFITTLASLSSGRGLTAENLADDFGPGSETAQVLVPALVAAVSGPSITARAQAFFAQWQLDMGRASGLPSTLDVPDWLELRSHLGVPTEASRRLEVLFALHTYFGIVSKLVCLVVLEGATGEALLGDLADAKDVWDGFSSLEAGSLTARTGTLNAVEPGLFSWYIGSRTDRLGDALKRAAIAASEYSAEVGAIAPLAARDLMKDLFQRLLPTAMRHRLGEYYTPDWLAEFLLDEVGYAGDPATTLLDPACGSGTFLVAAIARIRRWFEANEGTCGFTREELVEKIIHSVAGFDLSPLAVMAARTNYVIAIQDLLHQGKAFELPVYLCDSVLTPLEYADLFTGALGRAVALKTSAGPFLVPRAVTRDRDTMTAYASLLQDCINDGLEESQFAARLLEMRMPDADDPIHVDLYRSLSSLAHRGIDGIWANIIRNAFAPLLQERVDFVVGNPPWVFWNTLPSPYREDIKSVMVHVYKLAGGSESTMRRLGAAGKDLSELFVYVSLDRYLKDRGRLAFVITQTLFQSTAATEFRRWRLPDGKRVRVEQVDDWVKVRPFASAANKTATFVATRGDATTYPVSYRVWNPVGRFDRDSATLPEVRERTSVEKRWAYPRDPQTEGSLWVIQDSPQQLQTRSEARDYNARLGVETKLEGAYRVHVVDTVASDYVVVENIRDRTKIQVPAVRCNVEVALLHPYVTGASISRWNAFSPGVYVVPHTRDTGIRPIAEPAMLSDYPLTYRYLSQFRAQLEKRSLHLRWGRGNPFYALYDIGPYTFSPWKVVWKRTTKHFEASVVSAMEVTEGRSSSVIPNGKVMMIPFTEPAEANYVCAVLNSAGARDRINASISSEAHAEILTLIPLVLFDPMNETHVQLSELSRTCHIAAAQGDVSTIERLEADVDDVVAGLWSMA